MKPLTMDELINFWQRELNAENENIEEAFCKCAGDIYEFPDRNLENYNALVLAYSRIKNKNY